MGAELEDSENVGLVFVRVSFCKETVEAARGGRVIVLDQSKHVRFYFAFNLSLATMNGVWGLYYKIYHGRNLRIFIIS